jgi:hypothetical protein
MHRRLLPLTLLAGVALGAAATDVAHPPATPPSPTTAARPDPPTSTPRPDSADEAVAVARTFATAARTWTAETYTTAWRTQLTLAAPGYRRALRQARPTAAQVQALRAERARAHATVLGTERDPRVALPRARVIVSLQERTDTAHGALAARTRNEVRLEQRDGRWRVTGWTLLAGDDRP